MSYGPMVLLTFAGPLLAGIALIGGLMWAARQIYHGSKGQDSNAVSRIVKGQERLAIVFWRWGIIGYPVFALAVGAVLLIGSTMFLGGFMSSGRGPDMSSETLATWDILACYRLAWFAAIIRCRRNTGKKEYSIFAIAAACTIVLVIVIEIPKVISSHSQMVGVHACRKSQHLGPGGIVEPKCDHEEIAVCTLETLCIW
jgi:hypothetical protein